MSRRAVIEGPERLRLERHEPSGEPHRGFVRLEVKLIGICGSDLHVLAGHHPFVSYPVVPGHELVGEVVLLGSEVDESLLGTMVTVEPSLPCGECRACRRGDYNICEDLRVLGFQAPGGMGDALDVPASRLHALPNTLAPERAVFAEPTAVALHAVRLSEAGPGAEVAVVGAGTIGLLCAQAARNRGASVSLIDTDGERRRIANSLGFEALASLEERSVDVAMECVGTEGAIRSALEATRKGGLISIVGVHGKDARLQVGLIQDRELRLVGVLMYRAEDFREAIELLDAGTVTTAALTSEIIPLDRVGEGFELARRGGSTLKVLLRP